MSNILIFTTKNGDKQCKENKKNTNSTNMQVHRYKYI